MGTRAIREDRKDGTDGKQQTTGVDGNGVGQGTQDVPSVTASDYTFNPGDFTDSSSDSKPGEGEGGEYQGPKRRRRGRGPAKQGKKEANANLTQILLQTHFMLASLLDAEELIVNNQEANNLASAIQQVEDLYRDTQILSPEIAAWLNLTVVAGTIYIPRYMAYRVNHKKKDKGPIEVTPISTGYEGTPKEHVS